MKPVHGLRSIVLMILSILCLAACGGSPSSTTTPAPATDIAAQAPAATQAPAAAQAPAATQAPAAAQAATNTKLNLNTVTQDQLLSTIPNMGSRMVREFFEYRPYTSIQQFRKEIGKYVDAAQVTSYEQYVYVPISVDNADVATIQQIPGIDAATADALIAARPYNSNTAFLAKIAELAPGVDQGLAGSYLEP